MPTIDYILIVIAAILGLAVLIQIIVLTAAGMAALKAIKAAREFADEARPMIGHARDLMQTSKQLLARVEPKLDAAAGDLAEIMRTAREETERISASAEEITERIRRQAERMEGLSNDAINGVERAGHVLNQAVNTPFRQVSGVLAAARAVLNSLRSSRGAQRPSPNPEAENEPQSYA